MAISRGLKRTAEMAAAPAAEKVLSPNPKFISEDMDERFPSKSTLVVAAVNHEDRLRQPNARVER